MLLIPQSFSGPKSWVTEEHFGAAVQNGAAEVPNTDEHGTVVITYRRFGTT
jgi:hypothetical protein